MKSNYLKHICGGAIVALTFVVGFGLSSMTVQAQYPGDNYRYRRQQEDLRRQEELRRQQEQQDEIYQENDRQQNDRWGRDQNQRYGPARSSDGYPNWGGGFELRQTALNAGYNEGVKLGRHDRNRRRSYGYGNDFRNSSSYLNATKDYNSRFGYRELYRRYFQMAFETGYSDGLSGY
jgi:hypothetical protein